jgi:hypothetical protein
MHIFFLFFNSTANGSCFRGGPLRPRILGTAEHLGAAEELGTAEGLETAESGGREGRVPPYCPPSWLG